MYCNYEQNDWANLLDTAAFVYNNTVHNSIGVSPFFACYGWNPKAHPDIPQQLGVNDPGRFEYLMNGKERCKYLQEQIREAQRRSVDQYNRKHKDIEFKVGDMVYINCRNWKTRRPTPKLDTWFAGPYPVQERVGCQAYRITLPANLRVHDVFHPTIPSLPDEDLDFEVEALINKRSHNGTTEYKVLWRGYSEEAASWEPVENLNCPDLIQEHQASIHGSRFNKTDRIAYFNWSPSDINNLVDIIYNNDHYQRVLLPGCLTAEQEKGLKTNKDVICGQIWQELFPDESTVGGAGQVKTKICWLTEQYNNIKKTILQQTSAGVLLQDMDHNSSDYATCESIARSHPWFEHWHKMMTNHAQTGPVVLLTATPAAASSSSCSPFSSSSNPSSIGPTPFTITPIDTPTRQRSSSTTFEADEVDDGDGDSVYHSPATGTTPKKK
ncbi:hypothetical protein NDA10_002770 [Ustilago hordei]|nr:hypothetical protein NDA10_002770 [Ustilago hordei]